jgi:DNA-binding NtrC family response regulator/tetratricopeptide (TPR) repeat protein
MVLEPSPQVQSALQLLRRGRFAEIVTVLQQSHHKPSKDPLLLAILADALQRVGQNDGAESIARSNMRRSDERLDLSARFHFVLGNVLRERGDIANATQHFQTAATLSTSNPELSCWVHLRLLAAVAEMSGWPTAIARVDEVKRILTRYGDPRPFAALHLWHVETDTMAGALQNARRHLTIAESLLTNIDDLWLHGYLAVNSSVLLYYSADVTEALRWAQRAITCAQESGHRTTRRAAYANIGYFEFSRGEFGKAQEHFEMALQSCEHGSASEIAILDNIAETQLERGDLEGCRSLLSRLEQLAADTGDTKKQQYKLWGLQTKIKLLLREGRQVEATTLSQSVQPIIDGLAHARLGAESRLLIAEALLPKEPTAATDSLAPMFFEGSQLSPDLFAELERISGTAMAQCGSFHLARVHLERSASVFETLGHSLGKDRALRSLANLPTAQASPDGDRTTISLDRFRTLLDMRNRAELFGREVVTFLRELGCAQSVELNVTDNVREPQSDRETIRIHLGAISHKRVDLSFIPFADAKSRLTALSFKRVITQLLTSLASDAGDEDQDILWTPKKTTTADQGLVFASEAMRSVLRTVKQIGPTDVSVLITGETGTGKEVVARAIHDYSRRSTSAFLAINCAAVPRDLLESQLFGHRRGAFSGATETYQGVARAASGGTLFLDEISDIPIDMQTKLLRFLELNEVHPVGEPHPIKVDVRLVFATNVDLEEAVARNQFRRDLFYRLNVIPIKLPPLRDRREEIPVLTNVFAQRCAVELSKEPLRFTTEAMEYLIFYEWPGNIRQLSNEIRRLTAVMQSGACVTPEHLSAPIKEMRIAAAAQTPAHHVSVRINQSMDSAITLIESEMIKAALRRSRGRVGDAAASLGISRKGLYLKRVRLGLIDFNDAQGSSTR